MKILEDQRNESRLFRLHDIPSMDLETKLGILSFWLLEAERLGISYALQLGHETPHYAKGPAQLHRCLHRLATYQ